MNVRYVVKPIEEIPLKEEKLMEKPPMDFFTKMEGSQSKLA